MADVELYFATNRNHLGRNRWQPNGYGPKFSSDGHDNLRFGKLTVTVNQGKVDKLLGRQEYEQPLRIGNGEQLAEIFTTAAKRAKIQAFEDQTHTANDGIEEHENASACMFKELKAFMHEAHDIIIFIHGFNVDWYQAVGSALALEHMLNRPLEKLAHPIPDTQKKLKVVLFSWPSDGQMVPWRSYTSDRRDARQSGEAVGRAILKLRDFLLHINRAALKQEDTLCDQSLHLLAHSMGNFVLQNTLQKLLEHLTGSSLPCLFESIFMCAADVDDNSFERTKPLERLPEICRQINIYTNRGDAALSVSDFTKGNPDRLGHNGPSRPQALHHKINQLDCSNIVTGFVEHSYYLWATVNEDILQTLHDVKPDASIRQRIRKADGLNIWTLT